MSSYYKVWSSPWAHLIRISKKNLTLTENNVPKYGLKYSISPRSNDNTKLRASIVTLIRKLYFENKIELTFDDEIALRDTTERFISKAQRKYVSSKQTNIKTTVNLM